MPRNSTGQILAIVLASALIIALGALLSMYFGKRAKNSDDWLAAPESLPLGVVVITQFATAVGGGVLIAHVGIAYSAGWSVFAYEGCVLLGFLGLALIARWLRQQRFTTVPDIVSRLFGTSRPVTAVASLAALIVPFGWLATQFVAFAKLFGELTGISATALILTITAGSLVFVLPGGLTSVVWTDFVFGIFKIVMSLVVAAYAVHLAGGWSGMTGKVPDELWRPSGITAVGGEQIGLWVAAIVPGTLTNQLYFQRVFATKKVSDARRGLVLSGVTILVGGLYAGCIGLAVRAMNPGLANPEDAAGWLITRLPAVLLVVYGAFLVATIISTTGAALQSVVANVIRDLYQNVFARRRDDRGTVSLSRAVTVLVAVLAAGLAIAFPSALDWLVASYAYSAATLAAPVFGGYLLRRRFTLRPVAALGSMLAGIAGCAAAQLAGTTVPYAVYGIGASVLALLVLLVSGPGRRPGAPEPAETALGLPAVTES
ncbi:sodium:solute symporter family protein [Streptomyces albus subsp. chlorinus]|uniref:sodium:solute symporter family protein n=1 Tax=Streptomyces albus TaxID=1888 RepID=UPI0015706805|nr:sodium:solute symporter family protein [Streptomyces albus]NSC20243.1 sodium:solute symporter family protein [Streptomyces albus subsp. chlorinus]